ncbi:hypothetical protein [Kutzneria buriramensis]|uniref:Uncharacterized protein n=1 Tax=Kutzneria buriramensis TaxID=1045776 RepID=A0A3E0IB03_9PSEU|nr:hypothetical protein [Kutzneria buriramensis]REH55325.1 hypothetical protein BCF44_101345 [Kutzneria buriramensis]
MSRESGSERSQRTVAELLAQYGANSEDSAPRRRRRRADEPTDTAPQAIIDRVLSDSGNLMAIRDDVEETTVGTQPPVRQQPPTPPPPPAASQQLPKRPVQQPPTPGPQQTPPPVPQAGQSPSPQAGPPQPPTAQPPQAPPPAAASQATATGMRPPVRPGPPGAPAAGPGRTPPPPPPRIESSRTNLSRADLSRPNAQQPQPTAYFRPVPPGTQNPPPVDATADTTYLPPITADTPPPNSLANRLNGAPPQEGVTEQMPRIPASVGESTQAHPGPLVDDDEDAFGAPRGAMPPMESTQAHAGPYVDDDDDQYEYDDYQGNNDFSYSVDHDAAPAGVGGALEVEDGEAAEETEGSPGKQWLMMIAQLAIGVVGGAALWLGFQWLWNALPAAALAAAVAVIVALVIVVRRIRKADDLQTMVLAVLVGLIVTVSPAALRLIGH